MQIVIFVYPYSSFISVSIMWMKIV